MRSAYLMVCIVFTVQLGAQEGSPPREQKIDSLILDSLNRETAYFRAIQQGDSVMRLSDFTGAKAYYRRALNLKPTEQYPRKQIEVCDSHPVCSDKHFMNAIRSADSLYMQGEYLRAKCRYQEALALKAAESYPAEQIKKCDEQLAAIALNKTYDFYVKQADSFFVAKEYRQAKTWYEEATRLKPANEYPILQIGKCNEFLKEE